MFSTCFFKMPHITWTVHGFAATNCATVWWHLGQWQRNAGLLAGNFSKCVGIPYPAALTFIKKWHDDPNIIFFSKETIIIILQRSRNLREMPDNPFRLAYCRSATILQCGSARMLQEKSLTGASKPRAFFFFLKLECSPHPFFIAIVDFMSFQGSQLEVGKKVCHYNSSGISFMQKMVEKQCSRSPKRLPAPKGLVNSHRRSRSLRTPLLAGCLSNDDGSWPFFRSSNNVAFKMLLTLHNSTHSALHTRLWGSASTLWPVWRDRQHVAQRAPWMKMSSLQCARRGAHRFVFLGWSLADWRVAKPIYIHTFLPGTSLDSRKTQNFTKVRKVVSVPLIFSAM